MVGRGGVAEGAQRHGTRGAGEGLRCLLWCEAETEHQQRSEEEAGIGLRCCCLLDAVHQCLVCRSRQPIREADAEAMDNAEADWPEIMSQGEVLMMEPGCDEDSILPFLIFLVS